MSEEHTLFVALLALSILGIALRVVRTERVHGPPAGAEPWAGDHDSRAIRWGALATLASAAPLILVAPWISGHPPAGFADDVTHARVAAEIASSGLSRGWIEAYLGGFPFAVHYPPAGAIAAAALIRLGLSPLGATHLLGSLALVASPLALYVGAVRCGARPAFAVLGALCLAWVAPYNGFVGGYESFFGIGLLSQVLALPICILWASTMARGSSSRPAAVLAVLAVLMHPQVAVATLVVVGVACLVAGDAGALERCIRSGIAALAVGAAVYGPGVATLQVPFGWPPGLGWRHVGFPPERLEHWLIDGALLDLHRPAVLTHLAFVSVLALLLQAKRPVARGLLVACGLTLLLSVSGRSLQGWGSLGAWLLSFLQPLRVLALAPVVAGSLVIVALEQSMPRVGPALVGKEHARRFVSVASVLVAIPVFLVLPARVERVREWREVLADRQQQRCGPSTPLGYDSSTVHAWLRGLSGGRLWHSSEAQDPMYQCVFGDELELSMAVPSATATAVGAHVGVLAAAFGQVEPLRPGSADRAEAIGVRHAIVAHEGDPTEGWRRMARSGAVQLWSLERPTSLAGAGCVEEVWRGTEAELRQRIFAALEAPAGVDRLLSPASLVALEANVAEAEQARVSLDGCNPDSARVEPRRIERGLIDVMITTETPVDVVLRVTAFPGWRIRLDDTPVSLVRRVAPGFPSVRVPPGRHRLVAEVGWLPGYGWGLLMGAIVAALAATARRSWFRR
jgi:hypothetical protein